MADDGGIRSVLRALWRPEVARTCKSCGYSWKVPHYDARTRPKGVPLLSVSDGGKDGYISQFSTGRLDAVVERNAHMADEVALFRSCARCGSQQYSQKRIWRESKSDLEGGPG